MTTFLSVCSKFEYSQRDLSPDNVTQVSIPYPQHSWMTYLFAYLLSLSNPHPKIGCTFEGNGILTLLIWIGKDLQSLQFLKAYADIIFLSIPM